MGKFMRANCRRGKCNLFSYVARCSSSCPATTAGSNGTIETGNAQMGLLPRQEVTSVGLDVPLSPPFTFTTKATDSRTHAKQSGDLLDSDALTADSIAKRECSAGSAKCPRSQRQRNVRPANDTSSRTVSTEKITAWNCTSRQQGLRAKVPEAALSEPASVS
jgi:hypothetical protein